MGNRYKEKKRELRKYRMCCHVNRAVRDLTFEQGGSDS